MNDDLPSFVFVSPYRHGNAMSGARRRTTELCKALQNEGLARVVVLSPWLIDNSTAHISFNAEGGPISRMLKYIKLMYLLKRFRNAYIVSEYPIAPLPINANKILHVIHDAKFATDVGRKGRNLTLAVHKISSRICHHVITVSEPEKKRLSDVLELDPKKIVVSRNGLSEEWFRKLPQKEPEYDLLYVSNFAPHKNHLGLLKACVGSNWRIAFVGSDMGTLESCIDYAAENNLQCSFLSKLSDDELIEVYDASRVFVFPSKLEGFGIPFIEARSRGLPVVANDIDIFRALTDSLHGTLVDFENPSEAKSKIAHTLKLAKCVPDNISDYRWGKIAKDFFKSSV